MHADPTRSKRGRRETGTRASPVTKASETMHFDPPARRRMPSISGRSCTLFGRADAYIIRSHHSCQKTCLRGDRHLAGGATGCRSLVSVQSKIRHWFSATYQNMVVACHRLSRVENHRYSSLHAKWHTTLMSECISKIEACSKLSVRPRRRAAAASATPAP